MRFIPSDEIELVFQSGIVHGVSFLGINVCTHVSIPPTDQVHWPRHGACV